MTECATITIAATYPAAVIAMGRMRGEGSLLGRKENMLVLCGDAIGESGGGRCDLNASRLLLARPGPSFCPADGYWTSTALIMVGEGPIDLSERGADAALWRVIDWPGMTSYAPPRPPPNRAIVWCFT